MTSEVIRQKFLDFFEARGHAIVPSSSLIPDDPSVLLTTAGMQQFKRYYTGELDPMKDFGSKNTVSIQKSFRTSDIDEVGDESHLTFFEMLGNFSFGGYWKKEAITYAYDFLTKELKLPISYITVFKGSEAVPKDIDSKKIWNSLGVSDVREEGMEDVFWGPTGTSGPCGPTTEIYCKSKKGKDVEIWNIVFNEFFCDGSREELLKGKAELKSLETKGIDTGMGFERLVMVSQNVPTIFDTDLFKPFVDLLQENTPDTIGDRNFDKKKMAIPDPVKRVIVDHARGIVFLITDGVLPSNKDAGYILRRLMRRYIFRMFSIGDYLEPLKRITDFYKAFYPELDYKKIESVFEAELSKFLKTLTVGLGELYKMVSVDAVSAFSLYQSYGLPYEVIKDYAGEKAKNLRREKFDEEFKKHQELSRAGAEKKFGGHGLILDTGELKAGNEEELKKVLRLHTATHLLQRALREVLGSEVEQRGSDITPERTRFDFSFPRKLTPEEIKKVEDLVNKKIKEDLPVSFKEMSKAEAQKSGALYFFKEKYPEKVKVYYVGKDLESAWSKEFCGGPHVANTGIIGKFRIMKEEAIGTGTRRIRATVE